MSYLLNKMSISLVLLALCSSANALQLPSAGSQLQQIPISPIPNKAAPGITIEQNQAPAILVQDHTKIIVKSLHIIGNQVYFESELLDATGFSSESELTLTELRSMSAKIVDYYHNAGFFLAQAYLPAQEIKNGAVTIAVLEGSYGQITLRNKSNLSEPLVNTLLDDLNNGDAIAIAPLESRLLMLSDLPGVNVKSTLIPGASVGSSDLIVDVNPGQRLTGSISADNQGSRYTGTARLGATLNINEPFGHGDVTTLQVLTSAPGLNYGRASHQMQFGRVKAGVAYAHMDYKLGQDFKSLQANGTAKVASIYGSYPLIRQRKNSLYVQVNYDDKSFQDKIDATTTVADKDAHVLIASINGDYQDDFGGGGLSNYSLTWTVGVINIRSPDALTADALAAKSNGHYDKLGFNVSRLQRLTDVTSFYAVLSGQFSSQNLDTSEKMGLGGAGAVRAYPAGEAYGDQGYVLNLEVRRQLPRFFDNFPGQMQLIGFVDTGSVELNKNPWDAKQNRRTLSGAGIGLDWSDSNKLMVKAYFAHKLGNALATSAPDEVNRFWIEGVKYF